MLVFGIDAFVRLISHLLLIYLSFWSLQSLRIEQFFKPDFTQQIKTLIIFLSIALGYTVSSFFLEFIILCRNLFFGIFH